MKKSTGVPQKSYNKEIMREYPLHDLLRKGTVRLTLGDIVSLKALAIRKGFNELADKLRAAETKIMSK